MGIPVKKSRVGKAVWEMRSRCTKVMRPVGRRGLSSHSSESDARIIDMLAAAQSASELRIQVAQSASELRIQVAQSESIERFEVAQRASEVRIQKAQIHLEYRLGASQSALKEDLGKMMSLNNYKLLGFMCTAFTAILAIFSSVGGDTRAPW